jgi:hypothetical protein
MILNTKLGKIVLILALGLDRLSLGRAEDTNNQSTASPSAAYPGLKRVIPGRMLVHAPATQPACSKLPTSYELGSCFQLDRTNCMLVSNLDEQGGPDLCVGNDAFIFQKLSDIKADKAIIINRAEPEFKSPSQPGTSFLAKYPVSGFFVPLGALLPNGQPHPGAGTGLLMSSCVAYNSDRSDPTAAGRTNSNWKAWDQVVEFIQVSWDGKELKINSNHKVREVLGQPFTDAPFSRLAPIDQGFVGICAFGGGKLHPVRFDWDGQSWAPTSFGPLFTVTGDEFESTILHQGDRFLASTRDDKMAKVRIYSSTDGVNFKFLFDAKNHYVPRVLNKGLDGSVYLATDPGPGFLRNPLLAYPMIGDSFGQPVTIYDQGGIRNDKGDAIPFVDHGQADNVFLEGRWRHLIIYRVCDLKERTLYGFQKSQARRLQGDKGPIPKRPTSGVYVTEFEYDKVVAPYHFANE